MDWGNARKLETMIWRFPGWLIETSHLEMDDLEVPPFLEMGGGACRYSLKIQLRESVTYATGFFHQPSIFSSDFLQIYSLLCYVMLYDMLLCYSLPFHSQKLRKKN